MRSSDPPPLLQPPGDELRLIETSLPVAEQATDHLCDALWDVSECLDKLKTHYRDIRLVAARERVANIYEELDAVMKTLTH